MARGRMISGTIGESRKFAALAAIQHLGHHRADDKCYSGNAPVIQAAYAAARAARFAHGQNGAT